MKEWKTDGFVSDAPTRLALPPRSIRPDTAGNRHRLNHRPSRVPPSPEVLSMLFMEYIRVAKPLGITFRKYLEVIGYADPARDVVGMDDRIAFKPGRKGPERIDVPSQPILGALRVKVLLVDFDDRPGTVPAQYFDDLLFSEKAFPSGSMRDFYGEVSLGKVKLTGSVHGWFRLPHPYSYYTNNESGTEWGSYPRNAPRMAEDAVHAAILYGVPFESDLDKLGQGIVTALFIIHAGRGAEVMPPALRGREIWSHKWQLRHAIDVGSGLAATIYLTVPEDCKVGVCAHELGHLAFQWQDFYDPNYDEDGKEWDGSGRWDLMAGGSYNGGGARPAHPAGLHKAQHGWVTVTTVKKSTAKVTLPPFTPTQGELVRIDSPRYGPKRYLLLENRQRQGFDFDLPGQGLLVWRVDESGEQEDPDKAGLSLIQADGRGDLNDPDDWNQGDAGDPFPGSSGTTSLKDTGTISTSFADEKPSGVALSNIRVDESTKVITLDVTIAL